MAIAKRRIGRCTSWCAKLTMPQSKTVLMSNVFVCVCVCFRNEFIVQTRIHCVGRSVVFRNSNGQEMLKSTT
jgi:hypothetical protein